MLKKECRREAGAPKLYITRGDILRFFSARCDLRAVLPIVAKLADQIKRAGDENGVFGRGFGEGMFEGAFGVGNHGKTRSMMAGDFGELRGRDGARRAWCGKDDFRGVGEKEAGDFVNGLIPESGVEQPNLAPLEILLQKMGEFAGGAWIVSAVAVYVKGGLQVFEASGPHGIGNSGY